jgi:hypothetical protein
MASLVDNKTVSSGELLEGKSLYNSRVLPVWQTKKIKDFLSDEKIFYGRIDQDNNPIHLKKKFLAMAGKGANSVFVHDFVANAFSDMQSRADSALKNGQASNGVLFPLVAKFGWYDPISAYSLYSNKIASDFNANFLNQNMKVKIIDFHTFLPFFYRYLKLIAPTSPITRSGYIVHRRNSPLSSGLMIEVADFSYSDDVTKNRMFYSNPDFELFRDIAYFHGFVLDKNIPWRLVADINSPNMLPYLKKWSINKNPSGRKLFRTRYMQAWKQDMIGLMLMALTFYNSFVEQNPWTQIRGDKCPEIIERSMTSYDEIQSATKLRTWIEIYTNIRNIETGIDYGEEDIKTIIENALDLNRKFDRLRMMRYINNKFNSVEHYGGSLFYDRTRLEMSRDPRSTEGDVANSVKKSVQGIKFKTF